MKICSSCKKSKEDNEFNRKGLGLSSKCKDCNSEYLREHYRNNKQYYLDKNVTNRKEIQSIIYDWLSTQKCKDCGINDVRVLEFDHLADKTASVSSLMNGRSIKRMIEEIRKCEIVCANCHKIRTYTRMGSLRSTYIPS